MKTENKGLNVRDVIAAATLADMKIGHDIISAGPNVAYWATVSDPIRPSGHIFAEDLCRLLVLTVPASMLAITYFSFKDTGWDLLWYMLIILPFAELAGIRLHQWLDNAMTKKMAIAKNLDRGRYAGVRDLSKSLGIPAEAITLDICRALAHEYAIQFPKYQAAVAAAEAKRAEDYRRAVVSSSYVLRTAEKEKLAALAATGTVMSTEDTEWLQHGSAMSPVAMEQAYTPIEVYEPSINPGSGLPMLPGGVLDIHSNTYGSPDHFQSDPFQQF